MSGAVEGVALPAPEDLRPWGYAPGDYVFKCQDCPPNLGLYERMGKLGDKRSWRCREHAIAARDAAPVADEPRTTPPARSYADGVAINLGDDQWKRIANAAAGDFVRVPVEAFANAAQAWRWILGIVPQTIPVIERAEVLEAMFAPPTDVADIAAAIRLLSQEPQP